MNENKITRREFLDKSAKGAVAAVAGLSAFENLLQNNQAIAAPGANNSKDAGAVISLPKGGGAIKGIGETFKPNPFTGTANISVPIAISPGRSGFGPQLSLQYSSGNGNGPFGLGWALSVPNVSRKTEKGIPKYSAEDTFVLSGAEDLVEIENFISPSQSKNPDYLISTFRPRVEGLFARIEYWQKKDYNVNPQLNSTFWKITTKENITSIYGLSKSASLNHPDKKSGHVTFQWNLELTYDAKGNYICYEYKEDNGEDIDITLFEQHRIKEKTHRIYQTYLKYIYYGNRKPFHPRDINDIIGSLQKPVADDKCFFSVVFDYGEHGDKDGIHDKITGIMHQPFCDETGKTNKWVCRDDPFSFYRAGFEIRTYRRCERVLMFHKIQGESPLLVRSTDFHYEPNPETLFSILKSVTQRGYKKAPTSAMNLYESEEISMGRSGVTSECYVIKSLPPLEFSYTQFEPKKQRFTPLHAKKDDMPPKGLNDPNYALVDLFKKGLPDVLETTPTAYYYWQNLGNGQFDQRHQLDNLPAGVTLDQEGIGFGDMAGDGTADLLVHRGATWGFYESDNKGGWKNVFQPYRQHPSFSLNDPNIRLVDLTGDGRADALRTEENSFVYFPCKGKDGFEAPQYSRRLHNLEDFPDVYFSDPRVQLADMSGDGLKDIVLIHSGRIDYWPNLGYGRFGKRITMKNSPRFGADFDPKRLFLVDINGNGCADVVYIESGKIQYCFNQSGNGWSDPNEIQGTPPVTNLDSIQVADMMGSGCSGILWSSDYRGSGRNNYLYLDFTGGTKPYVLTEINNNLGATTHAIYKPSTYFYLKDWEKKHRQPWMTTLPFPVQVLEQVEVIDQVSKTKLVTRYEYHHGYYDGREREFRGFAMVEQWDTEYFEEFCKSDRHDNAKLENVNRAYHVPPVYTKTWFHTGAYRPEKVNEELQKYRRNKTADLELDDCYSSEYYNQDRHAFHLPRTVIEANNNQIDLSSLYEAYRALRGQVLRQEVYAQDQRPGVSEHPYLVNSSNYKAKLLQPGGIHEHAVYLVQPYQTIIYHYERKPDDPRISQQLNLAYDNYGNLTESIQVYYPRRIPLLDKQGKPCSDQAATKAIYSFSTFINEDKQSGYYYIGLPCETKTFEVHGMQFKWLNEAGPIQPFGREDFALIRDKNEYEDFDYEPPEKLKELKKRIIKWSRQYYRLDNVALEHIDPVGDLSHRLAYGEIESLALPYESYQAAFTHKYIKSILPSNIGDDELKDGGYFRETTKKSGNEEDKNLKNYWWIPSGRRSYNQDKFYLSEVMQDPFGNQTTVNFDSYSLLMKSAEDALGNIVEAENDYRVLQPYQIKDPNMNISQVAFDALGMVVGTAVTGKKIIDDKPEGDSLDGFNEDLPMADIVAHVNSPLTNPHEILQQATTRIVYDLHCFLRTGGPGVVYSLARETHVSDEGGVKTKVQRSFSYSDGFGREIQKKIQAKPGPVPTRNTNGKIVLGTNDQPEMTSNVSEPRWVGSGWTIFNNKGKPVQQFEPFFNDTHHYEFNVQIGVSPVLFYDPIERIIATLRPNHTYEKVVFDPWQQNTYDVNDTVAANDTETGDPRNDINIAAYVNEYFKTLPLNWQTWYQSRISGEIGDAEKIAATKAEKHANSPTITHFDTLGRIILTIAHNRFERKRLDGTLETVDEKYPTYTILDIEGNHHDVIDAQDRIVMRYDYDMTGNLIHQASMEAGERWTLNDVLGKPIRTWDSRKFMRRMTYDALRRPVELFVTENKIERLAERTKYGENQGNANNLRTRIYQVFDGAGKVINESYDFKGNLLQSKRELLSDYRHSVDWLQNPHTIDGAYTTCTKFDALNRPIAITTPDGSIYRPTFNKANLLDKVDVNLQGAAVATSFVTNIDYNARGQREMIRYANGAETIYDYDDQTFRLIHLKTTRPAGLNGLASQLFVDPQIVQELHYTYDPVGNITNIVDNAIPSIQYNNENVEPKADYIYDAIYRLVSTQGREHIGQTAFDFNPADCNYRDYPFVGLRAHPNDARAMRKYTEVYEYDEVGNIMQVRHSATGGSWTRYYVYDEDSLVEKGKKSNRLTKTTVGNGDSYLEQYTYTDADGNDIHGCMTSINSMQMEWDFKDQLQMVNLGGGGKAYYVYDAGGQRVRKLIDQQNGTKLKERIYLNGFEIYREFNGNNGDEPKLERETLHVMDDKQRIALVETRTQGNDPAPKQLIRYQFGNHLGSVSLELDDEAQVFSYEEYFPYGCTAFQAVRNQAETPKRYRYTGKERDEESGLYYYGARYFTPWLGRWISCDPEGFVDGLNLFIYVNCNPIKFSDKTGTQSQDQNQMTLDDKDYPVTNLPNGGFDFHADNLDPEIFNFYYKDYSALKESITKLETNIENLKSKINKLETKNSEVNQEISYFRNLQNELIERESQLELEIEKMLGKYSESKEDVVLYGGALTLGAINPIIGGLAIVVAGFMDYYSNGETDDITIGCIKGSLEISAEVLHRMRIPESIKLLTEIGAGIALGFTTKHVFEETLSMLESGSENRELLYSDLGSVRMAITTIQVLLDTTLASRRHEIERSLNDLKGNLIEREQQLKQAKFDLGQMLQQFFPKISQF